MLRWGLSAPSLCGQLCSRYLAALRTTGRADLLAEFRWNRCAADVLRYGLAVVAEGVLQIPERDWDLVLLVPDVDFPMAVSI